MSPVQFRSIIRCYGTAFGVSNFNSALVNENQVERSIFNVIAWQKSFGPLDSQVSYFQRYSSLHFIPDTIGDLVFNGVASDVTRNSLVNGLQGDNAYRVDARASCIASASNQSSIVGEFAPRIIRRERPSRDATA